MAYRNRTIMNSVEERRGGGLSPSSTECHVMVGGGVQVRVA